MMRIGITAALVLLLLLTFFVGQLYNQRAKDQAATAQAIDSLIAAQKKYADGTAGRDGFFENLTVRNLTVTDSNAGLRILMHTNDDGSAQISFYGEHSVFGGVIRVEKDGTMSHSLDRAKKTN